MANEMKMLKGVIAISFVLLLVIAPTLISTKAISNYGEGECNEKGLLRDKEFTVHVTKNGENVKGARVFVLSFYREDEYPFRSRFLFRTKKTKESGKANFSIPRQITVLSAAFGEQGSRIHVLHLRGILIFAWKFGVGSGYKGGSPSSISRVVEINIG